MEKSEPSYPACAGHFGKHLAVPQKVKQLPHDPATPLLGIHLRKVKTYVHTKTCTWMFIAELFIIVKKWKQSKCLSTDDG